MKTNTKVSNSAKVKAHFLVTDRKMTKTDVANEFGVSRRTLGRWLEEVEHYRNKAQEEVKARKQQVELAKPEPVLPKPKKKSVVVYFRCTTTRTHKHFEKVRTVSQKYNNNFTDSHFLIA